MVVDMMLRLCQVELRQEPSRCCLAHDQNHEKDDLGFVS